VRTRSDENHVGLYGPRTFRPFAVPTTTGPA